LQLVIEHLSLPYCVITKTNIMKKVLGYGLALLPLIGFSQDNNAKKNDTSATVVQDNISLSGRIIDEKTNAPLAGATIHLKNTTHEIQTDGKGEFKFLTGQKLPVVFIVSYIGYETLETTVDKSTGIIISLRAASAQLNDVVVVGYGTQKRKALISAVSSVNASEIKNIPVAGFNEQLQGKASGVQINANTGIPGDGVFVRVRGATSINASNDPLYIIDGVFINNTSLQTVNTGGRATSPIADINPADIESIEVLKDASATAIYGARGANGVVIISTKRGEYNAKARVSAGYSQGWAKAPSLWDLTTGPEHATLVNEFYANSFKDATSTADKTKYQLAPFRVASAGGRGLPEEQKTYDRLGQLFRTARLQDYNLSVTGGSKGTKYYIGGSYTNQEAIIRPLNFNRASFKFNADQKISDKLQVGVSNSFTRSYRNQARAGDGPAGGMLQSALHTPTYLPEVNADGTPARWAGFDNLKVLIDNYNVQTTSLRYIGNLYIDAELIRNLKFRSSWSLDYNNYDESEYWNDQTQLGAAPANGLATSALTQNTTWINEQTLSYRTSFNNQQSLGILVGNSLQGNVITSTSAQGSGFPNNSFTLISAAATRTSSQLWTKATLASFFSRIDYSYANKYFAEFSIRADGSSRFGVNNKFGYFPSIGAGWRVKEESFLKDVAVISDLKLRASYGITGNQNGISNFAPLGTWSGGSGYPDNSSGDKPGIAPQQLANPDLRWEKTSQVNAGVDIGLFRNRINVEFNVYSKYSTDNLLQLPVPGITGFTTYYSNAGEISNRGFELSISSVNIKNKDFSWQTSFNISGNENKIEKLATAITQYNRDWVRLQEGYSLYSFWLYRQLYVDQQTGNAVFEDVNKDGQITVADRQIIGNAAPKLFGGLTNNLSYKGFDLGILFSFQSGNKVFNLNRFFGEGGGTRDANRILLASQLQRWQKPGDITDVPRLTAFGNNYTLEQNSRFLEDGSFIKLRSLTFGYTIPRSITSKARLETVRFYFSGTNLFTITKYTGPDPEVNVTSNQNIQGLDLGTPPQPRVLQFGVNVSL
jgi:TonB-dependent starch-binding outer membrane protein SusC